MSNQDNKIAVLPAHLVEEFAALVPVLVQQTQEALQQLADAKSAIKMYSLDQIAEQWCFDVLTVRRHLKRHSIKPVKFADNRSIRYKATDIENLIKKLSK